MRKLVKTRLTVLGRKDISNLCAEIKIGGKNLEDILSGGGVIYHAAGNATLASLPTPGSDYEGFTYNMTEDFTTTSDFVEGAGKSYPAGSNVAVVNVGTAQEPQYKYDVLGGGGGSAAGGNIRILFIGNSNMIDSVAYLPYIMKGINPNVKTTIGTAYIAGSCIAQHLAYFSGADASHKVTITIPSTDFSGEYAAGTFDFWTVAADNKPYKAQLQGNSTVREYYGYSYHKCVNGGAWSNNEYLLAAELLAAEKWDVIVFQDAPNNVAWSNVAPFLFSLQRVIGGAVDHAVKFGWLATHAAGNTVDLMLEQWEGLAGVALSVMQQTGTSILFNPGSAVQGMRTVSSLAALGDGDHKNMTADDIHLQEGIGCYGAACAVACGILNAMGLEYESVIGEQTRPDADWVFGNNIPGPHAGTSGVIGITDANCLLAQVAAVNATKYPYKVISPSLSANANDRIVVELSDSDYESINNKPSINSVTLQGNKSASDLGLATAAQGEKADSSVQNITRGGSTLTKTNGIVDIPEEIQNVAATPVAAGGSPTVDLTNGTLTLGIPRGVDAVNPFKGYYPSTKPTGTFEDGDYIYAPDSTDGSTTTIWHWDETLSTPDWSDSGKAIDPAALVEFANTSKAVAATNVVNDLTTGGIYDVLSAEQGVVLAGQVSQLDQEINGHSEYQDISPTLIDDQLFNTNPADIFARYPTLDNTGSKCCRIAVNPGEKYRIFGLGANQYSLLYAVVGPIAGSGDATAILKSSSELNARTTGSEVTIPEGGVWLLVNFYQYNSSTDKVQKYGIASSGIEGDIQDLEDRVTALESGGSGFEDRVEDLELSVNGEHETVVTESITATGSSWETYNLSQNIPVGAVIYSRSIPDTAYLVDTNNVMDVNARLDTISLPYTTTKEYKALTTRTAGNFSFTYRIGIFSAGLEDISTFKDKTIVCFGDSLTENSGTNGKRYSDILAQLSHANVINVGVGGARIQQRRTPVLDLSTVSDNYERWQTAFAMFDIVNVVRSACNLTDGNGNYYRTYMDNAELYLENPTSGDAVNLSAFKARLYAIDWSNVDVVTVFGGTNDWNSASEYLGESGSTNPSRTLGAINTIIQSILTTYPHITLYWFTPIVRWIDYSGGTGIASNFSDNLTRSDMTLEQYSAILQNEVANSHVPCCDMYNTLGWNMYNFSKYFPSNDGTHPKKGKGFDCIARKMFYFISSNRTF